jgi:HK97 family phage portal protein
MNPFAAVAHWWRSRPDYTGMAGAGPAERFASPAAFGMLTPYRQGQPVYPSRDVAGLATEGYDRIPLIWSCVGLLADTAGAVPLRVYEEDGQGNRTPLPTHPLAVLMRRPNPQMSGDELIGSIIANASITPFTLIEMVRSEGGRVVQLWPLRSDWAVPILRSQAPPDWEYRIPGLPRPAVLKAENVLVHRWRRRWDQTPYGTYPLEILFRQIGIENAMVDFLKIFFDQGATPQLAIQADTMPGQRLNQAQIDELNEQFMGRHGGLHNSAVPFWLGGVKDIKRVGFDFDELAWTDLRDLDELAIVQAFGVPASMAQIRIGLEHSDSRANAEVDERKFYRQTVIPRLRDLDGLLTHELLPLFDARPNVAIEFDTSDVQALQEDRNARANALTPALIGGAIPVSVWCAELGLPEPPADFYLSPLSTERVPVADILKPPERVPPQLIPPVPPAGDDDDEPGLSRLRAVGPGPRHRWRAKVGAANRALIGKVANARVESFRRFFAEQGERVVAAYTEQVGLAALVGANGHRVPRPEGTRREALASLPALDWPAEDEALGRVHRQLALFAGETAFAAVNDALGVDISFDLANPNVRGVMDQLATRVAGIGDETRANVAEVITRGEEAGKTVDDIAGDLRGLFAETYRGRSLTIARTESMVSLNAASVLGYRESGVVDRVQLFDNPAHDTDPGSDGLTCAARNGLIVPLDRAERHIDAEHPNGTLAVAPVLTGDD